ncbi:MAG: HAD family phosphatase [Rubrivivax sp.]|jgi:putative hydrolase of the HAD superfamily|nr:HAD family phosphatase [Rubrivivax sp.]
MSPIRVSRAGSALQAASVVFDFGAVLFQWRPLQLLQQVVPELAPDEDSARRLATQIFESFTPDSDWARFDLGRIDEAALARRIAARIGAQPAQVRRVIDAIPPHLQAQPATVALLSRLKAAGHRLFYLSNMPLPYAAHLERENRFIADFDDGIFSGRVGLMKPHDAIFELAVQRFALDPARTLFIDDHAGNVQAARRLGWQALQFVDAAQCEQAVQDAGWL